MSSLLTPLLRVRPFEVELLRPGWRVVPLAWGLLALGALALAGAAWLCKPAWERQSELAAQRASLEQSLANVGAGTATGARRQAGKAEVVDEAAEIVAELHRPWSALFDQLEAATTPGVNLMQLSVEPHFATLQLVAESRDLDKLVRFSQRLAAGGAGSGGTKLGSNSSPSGSSGATAPTPGPIRSMNMTHHEWRDALGAHVVSAAMSGELAGGSTAGAALAQ
jgi:Tfp pilus assembly protein PilN